MVCFDRSNCSSVKYKKVQACDTFLQPDHFSTTVAVTISTETPSLVFTTLFALSSRGTTNLPSIFTCHFVFLTVENVLSNNFLGHC